MSISAFLRAMPDTVIYRALAGRDGYGRPTYATGTSYSARVAKKIKWIRKADGSEVLAQSQVWIGGTPDISPDDQLELPDGTTPPILMVERFPDELGTHHTKVYLG